MKDPANLLSHLPADLRTVVRPAAPLDALTTLRVGGPAALLCPVANPVHAQRFQAFARDHDLPFFILGGGSNVLADAAGRPVLIDFASAVRFRPRGPGARLLLPILARFDRRAVTKWRARVEPPAQSAGSSTAMTMSAIGMSLGSRASR